MPKIKILIFAVSPSIRKFESSYRLKMRINFSLESQTLNREAASPVSKFNIFPQEKEEKEEKKT